MTEHPMAALSDLGESMFRWIVWMNAWTLVMLAGAIAIDWALRRRVSAAWRIALYGAVLVRLAMPINWTTPVGLLGATQRAASSAAAADASGAADAVRTTLLYTADRTGQALPPAGARTAGPPWQGLIPLAYLVGVGALLARGVRARAQLRDVLSQSTPADERLAALARPLPVLLHPHAGPMLIGLRHPHLVLPASNTSEGHMERLEWVIAHEQAHARRGDPWLALLIHLVTIAAWPIVPVWIAGTRLRALMEQACDERALAGRGEQARLSYAQTLIDAAVGSRRMITGPLLAAPALEFGVGLRGRILAMRFTRRWRSGWQGAIAAVGAAALVACAGTRPTSADRNGEVPVQTSSPLRERPLLMPQDDPRPVLLEFTLLEKWPEFPWLDATPDGRGPANGGIQSLYPSQSKELLATVGQGTRVVTSPKVLVRPGQEATISVGEDAAAGQPARSMSITAAATRNKGGFDVRVGFVETGPDARAAGPMDFVSWSDGTEVIPILESRPGQGGLLLLVRATDAPESAIGWPLVFYRINRVELGGKADFAKAVEESGGRKLDLGNTPSRAGLAYTLPAEFIEPLYDKLGVPDMQRFRIGHESHAQAVSGEAARVTLTSPISDHRTRPLIDGLELRGVLSPPANEPGPVQGGSLTVGLTWTAAGGVAVDVPPVELANYNAAAHHLALAVLWPGSPADGLPPRLMIVMPHRAGSEDDLPRQTMEIKPQTFRP